MAVSVKTEQLLLRKYVAFSHIKSSLTAGWLSWCQASTGWSKEFGRGHQLFVVPLATFFKAGRL